MDEFKILIQKASLISLKYQKLNEAKGGGFNLCSLLENEDDEVRLHSKMIAHLLHPQENHGKGPVFGNLFLNVVGVRGFDSIMSVTTEKSFSDGRIDIFLKGKDPEGRTNYGVIENKIWADDQPNQLERYWNFLTNKDSLEPVLIYLTPFEVEPSDKSFGSKKNEIKCQCISYKSHILKWLDMCAKECAEDPPLRESILMYRNVCRSITGQTLGKEETMEYKKLLLEGNYLKIANNIALSLEDAKAEVRKQFWIKLLEEIKEKSWEIMNGDIKWEYTSKIDDVDFSLFSDWRYFGIETRLHKLNDNDFLCYKIEVDHNIYLGFLGDKENVSNQVKYRYIDKMIQQDWVKTATNWYFGWKYTDDFGEYLNFKSFSTDVVLSLSDPVKLKDVCTKIAEEVYSHIIAFDQEDQKHKLVTPFNGIR